MALSIRSTRLTRILLEHGFSALVTLFPRDGVGIVALANKNGAALPSLATRHAADRILGLEYKDWSGEAL